VIIQVQKFFFLGYHAQVVPLQIMIGDVSFAHRMVRLPADSSQIFCFLGVWEALGPKYILMTRELGHPSPKSKEDPSSPGLHHSANLSEGWSVLAPFQLYSRTFLVEGDAGPPGQSQAHPASDETHVQ